MFALPERYRSWLRNMDNRNVSILGMRDGIGEGFKVVPVPFGIEQEDRRRHLYVVGKTGTGKTTLLQNLILQDLEEGRGFALLDPLGDLADELLDHIPPWRTDHVVYFNPADTEFPVAYNLLEDAPYEYAPSSPPALSGLSGTSIKAHGATVWSGSLSMPCTPSLSVRVRRF